MFISEIFQSIDGEVNAWGQGAMTTFIRFQGCNMNCSYCDTTYAKETKGETRRNSDVLNHVLEQGNRKVTLTGGEPMLQVDAVIWLCNNLIGRNKSIETNGSLPIPYALKVRSDVSLVIDYKLDDEHMMDIRNYQGLSKRHWVKFVVSNELDFKRVLKVIENNPSMKKANIALSPNHDFMNPEELINRLKSYRGDIAFSVNLQLHKYIWKKNMRGV